MSREGEESRAAPPIASWIAWGEGSSLDVGSGAPGLGYLLLRPL